MNALRRRADDESGFTLVELLVAVAIFTVVLSVVGQGLVTGMQAQRRQMERIETLNAGKLTLERVTRDLRAANPVVGPMTGDEVTVRTWRGSEEHLVRVRRLPGAGGARLVVERTVDGNPRPDQTLLTGLTDTEPVFTYLGDDGAALDGAADASDVAAVRIRLEVVLPNPERVLVFEDQVTVRNQER